MTHSLATSSADTVKSIELALATMAMFRGATVPPRVVQSYAERLGALEIADVLRAIEKFQDMPREKGDPAFPEIGLLIEMVRIAAIARKNREKYGTLAIPATPPQSACYYQQQSCPECGDVVAMMRPKGEQFRTWCLPCQAYRKIIPEDMSLTGPEWEMLCGELGMIYREWKRRGSIHSDMIDPQFDRELVRRRCA